MFSFDFCYGGLRYHPANFDLKLCKLPTSGRRAATTATETTSLRTRQYVLTPTYHEPVYSNYTESSSGLSRVPQIKSPTIFEQF